MHTKQFECEISNYLMATNSSLKGRNLQNKSMENAQILYRNATISIRKDL